jgi:hypothetical protein
MFFHFCFLFHIVVCVELICLNFKFYFVCGVGCGGVGGGVWLPPWSGGNMPS